MYVYILEVCFLKNTKNNDNIDNINKYHIQKFKRKYKNMEKGSVLELIRKEICDSF